MLKATGARNAAVPAGLGRRDQLGQGNWILPLLLLVVACVLFALAGALIWRRATATEGVSLQLSAAIVLLLAAAAHVWIARATWRQREAPRRESNEVSPLLLLRWSFLGVVLCYLAALALGPTPEVPFLFIAGIAGWQTLILLPLANPTSRRFYRQVAASCAARRCGSLTFALLLAAVSAEASLRAYSWLTGDRLAAGVAVHALTLPPASQFRGRTVNSQGFWGDEFSRELRPGRFRVAVLGGTATLSGTAQTNSLAQLERLLPGLEVYNFGVLNAGPQECAALAAEALEYRPDLVLAFVSSDDVAREPVAPGLFSWQSLRLWQVAAQWFSPRAASPIHEAAGTMASNQDYLRQCERRLALCRVRSDEATNRRWQAALVQLDDLVRQCRDRQVPVAIVAVPSDCQVDPLLCDAVRRRLGYEPTDLDLEAPRRRLVGFAEDRQLPVLDLLPYLRQADATPYVPRDAQWNDQGNALAAQALSRWLHARYGGLIAATAQANAH